MQEKQPKIYCTVCAYVRQDRDKPCKLCGRQYSPERDYFDRLHMDKLET